MRQSRFLWANNKKTSWLLAIACGVFYTPSLLAQEDILMSYGDEAFISIATGRKQLISKAPSVASVVTAEQIKQMGAKDIAEVMEAIPGVHVSRKAGGYNPIFIFRGIYSEFNPQVLILIDGIPLTGLNYGDRGQVWGGLPVASISRVEVIRGPGSAIYGADAFAGTINIITKSADDIVHPELGYSYGSYDEHDLWFSTKGEFLGWQTSFSFEAVDSNGWDETIDSDLQAALDTPPANASQTPGELSLSHRLYDFYFKANKDNWNFNFNYAERDDVGIGAGAAGSLDRIGRGEGGRLTAQVIHTNKSLLPDTEVKTSLSYQRMRTELDLVLFPPGAFAGSFPNGVIGQPDTFEEHTRLDLSFFYTGIDAHDVTIGTGYHYHDQFRVEEKKNYKIVAGVPVALPGLIDVSDTAPFNQEELRTVAYIYGQDVWQIAPDWSLTGGVRYDHYSDFGDTFNPRLALVWQTSYALTTKLLYGRAFRAPSFAELFNINNPVSVGNPGLDPERINTYELAFSYMVSADLNCGLNFFYYKMQDIIRFDPVVAENSGDQTGHGIEFEFSWRPLAKLELTGNYAWQSSEDQLTDEAVPNSPRHQLYLRADSEFRPGWSGALQLNRVMDRKRAVTDSRPAIADYTQIDLIVRAERVIPTWELAAGVKNLFDEEIYEPSLVGPLGVALPGDLPLAGRNFFAEVRKTF